MANTLEQQRAKYSWEQVKQAPDDFTNLAKGAPALIMSNGLMASLAFWQSRGTPAAGKLVGAILGWLAQRKILPTNDFKSAMDKLVSLDSNQYMLVTSETLDLLKWLRQFAAAAK